MSLDSLTRWLSGLAPRPPVMPALPDFRTFTAPRALRNIPGFNAAWSTALAEIQARVNDWAVGAWDFLVRFNLRAVAESIRIGLYAGLAVGFLLGFCAGIAFYSRHVSTLANRRAIDK